MPMRSRNRAPLIILLVIIVALVAFLLVRRTTLAAFGPAVALCPGPDSYGYTCAPGSQFTYIDALNDTFLYEDDGVTTVGLPFPFTFYGTTYTEATLSSNGNIQFGSSNSTFLNDCLDPAADLGDLIAPYWDDLNLTAFGFLETELVGEAPERIFVIEWDDVPRFGDDPDDRVTFEVQLFEGSNDIVFLYQDVRTFVSDKGSSATVGLQSELQGLALQFSCFQPVLADGSGLTFPHPAQPNGDVGQETAVTLPTSPLSITAKGVTAELMDAAASLQPAALENLKGHWLSQQPQRLATWEQADLTGDERPELIMLWRGPAQFPELAQTAVLTFDTDRHPALLLDAMLSTRKAPFAHPEIVDRGDLNEDGRADLLIRDIGSGHLLALLSGETIQLATVPEACQGNLTITDTDGDGRAQIVRDQCDQSPARVSYQWDGRQFRMSR
ncbi:MAG: hypothetical protein ACE5EY_07285 [Anaerolineae bacterium]